MSNDNNELPSRERESEGRAEWVGNSGHRSPTLLHSAEEVRHAAMGEPDGNGDSASPDKRKRFRKKNNEPAATKTKFVGECEDLEGFIFDCEALSPKDSCRKTLDKVVKHVGRNTGHKFGAAVTQGIQDATEPATNDPATPADCGDPAKRDAAAAFKWEAEVRCNMGVRAQLKAKLERAHFLVLGQCHERTVDQVRAHKTWSKTSTDKDLIRLLKIIKSVMLCSRDEECVPLSIHNSKVEFCHLQLKDGETLTSFHDRMLTSHEAPVACGGHLGADPGVLAMVAKDPSISATTADASERDKLTSGVEQAPLAMAFLTGLGEKCADVINSCSNDCTASQDAGNADNKWPKTLSSALHRAT